MKKTESVIIGHETMDINTDCRGVTVRGAGGAVLFSSASAYALGHEVRALTKVAEKDALRLGAFTLPPEKVIRLDSRFSTDMENTYFSEDKERRRSVCTSRGDPFTADDIPETLDSEIYHLAGLLYGDYSRDLIKELSKRGRVAVDVQGYLRHRNDADGSMYFEDWAEKEEMLPYIDFLKTDAAEAEIMTGVSDRAEAAKLLFKMGAKEILITHNTEVLAYDGKEIYTCPIKARNLSGRTGRGDTTFAAYITERLTEPVEKALLTATAAVSLKMETPGPMRADRKAVEQYIRDFYR